MTDTKAKPTITADLIQRLEAATEGSLELDALIHSAVTGSDVIYEGGERLDSAVIVGTREWTDRDGSRHATVEGYAPHYTTSLDAKIPGEDIVAVTLHEGDGYSVWRALHRCQHLPAQGKTEPLARRIAALRALSQTEDAR